MAPSARSHLSSTAHRQSRGPVSLPTYEPLQHPLNEEAQRALHDLPRTHKLDPLKSRLKAANLHLTQAAADINDRYSMKRVKLEKARNRREKQGSQEGEDDEDQALEKLRDETDSITTQLEGSVRKIIDASAEVEGVEQALTELNANVAAGRGQIVPTQSTLGASQFRQQRRRRVADESDEDSEFENDDSQQAGNGDSALDVLKRKIDEQRAAYTSMSMAERYASHNDYVGFKKIVHDAHYPDDNAPPMPHASTWFPSESPHSSHPTTRSAATAAGSQPIDDDDLAVASERISIKCPITLLPMKDPVTSTKCPHSFEKEAILSMINASEVRTGGNGRRGDGQKAMQCPVCEVLLTANDVKEDPVLIRKIKRIQAALDAQNEDSSDEERDQRRGSSGGHAEEVTSSPVAHKTPRLKNERQSQVPHIFSREVSMVPNSQVEDLT